MAGFHVVVTDLETGDVAEADVAEDDYFLLTTGGCELFQVTVAGKPYGSRHTLTITGRVPRESSADAIARNCVAALRRSTRS